MEQKATHEKKFVTVYGLRMCNELLRKGYQIAEISRDKRYPENVVFFFYNSNQIKKAIDEIAKQKSN